MSFASKFFAPGSSESESEIEEEEVKIVKKKVTKTLSDFSDDEDKVKRRVKSASQKKTEEFSNCVKKLKNSLKIKDFDAVSADFDSLHKLISKYDDSEPARSVIKVLTETEELTKKVWEDKELKNKMSKGKIKVLSTLRQKIKKFNKDFEARIQDCRDNPDEYTFDSDADQSDYMSDSDDDDTAVVKTKEGKLTGASAFMKVNKVKEVTKKRERKIKVSKKKSDEEEPSTQKPVKASKELFQPDEVINVESIVAKMREISKLRGKKISTRIILHSLNDLRKIVETHNFGNAILIKIYLLTLSLQFDNFGGEVSMKPDHWRSILSNYSALINLLLVSPDIELKEDISEEAERFSEAPFVIMGNCVHFIFKINDELTKIMQATDCYSLEYLTKMKDVTFFSQLVSTLQAYVEKFGSIKQICDVYLLKVEQMYYKLDSQWLLSLKEQLSDSLPIDPSDIRVEACTDEDLLNTLCQYLYKHGKDRIPLRAALCQVYHHAIHDRWNQAKQLFLMTRTHETINQADISSQILHNRALVQLGLCAFRKGYYKDALNSLRDIQTSGRARELLAQGPIVRNAERTSKQEMMERRYILPFHMHINLELVECVYLVSILVLEGAYSVAPAQEEKTNFSSRGLLYLARNMEKLAIQGPPESTREYIYSAFKSLRTGDWQSCLTHIKKIRCWKLLVHVDSVLSILEKRLKLECLVAYIFANSYAYSKITLAYLVEYFKLTESEVRSTINRIIMIDHFPAKWNQDATILTIYQDVLPNDTHILSASFIERLSVLSEHHNRMHEAISSVNIAREKHSNKFRIK